MLPRNYATQLFAARAHHARVPRISKLYLRCLGNSWAKEATLRIAREELRCMLEDVSLDQDAVAAVLSLMVMMKLYKTNARLASIGSVAAGR